MATVSQIRAISRALETMGLDDEQIDKVFELFSGIQAESATVQPIATATVKAVKKTSSNADIKLDTRSLEILRSAVDTARADKAWARLADQFGLSGSYGLTIAARTGTATKAIADAVAAYVEKLDAKGKGKKIA